MLTHSGDPSRRTAIVATLGPISEEPSCIEGLIRAGMDIARLSMSNGTRERHERAGRLVREIAAKHGRPVQLLADLQGRKNRLGRLPGGRADWASGDLVVLTAQPGRITPHRTWTTHPWHPERVKPGISVLVDDGAVALTVTHADDAALHCVVVEGGTVSDGRGVTIPGAMTYPPGLTPQDLDDLRFAQAIGVDMVALSFACSAADHDSVRALARDPLIIGKVEHPDAVESLVPMAATFDGLMVARGDLALEIPFEEVPIVQKRILAECTARGRLGMVATQLLHSMRQHARTTRAEAADVVNAVLDGAGALVLTGETGYGRHPVHVVDVLRRLIERAERHTGLPLPLRPRRR